MIVLHFYTFLSYHNSNWFIIIYFLSTVKYGLYVWHGRDSCEYLLSLIRDQFSLKLFTIFTEFIIFTCYFTIGRKHFLNALDVIILRSSCAIERPTTMNKEHMFFFSLFSFYSRSASSPALNEKAKNHTNSHIRIICWLCVSQWHVNNRDLCEQNLKLENNTKLLQIILHTLLSFVPLVCFYFIMGILSVSFALFDFTLVKGVSTDAFCSCNKN